MQMAFVEDEQQTSDVTQTVDVIVTLMTGHALWPPKWLSSRCGHDLTTVLAFPVFLWTTLFKTKSNSKGGGVFVLPQHALNLSEVPTLEFTSGN